MCYRSIIYCDYKGGHHLHHVLVVVVVVVVAVDLALASAPRYVFHEAT